ncbi:hypothetical protein FEM48_Zijuj12G0141500 [Ziziphus jujuba var. spinosa]|uniref:Uncharacterized protein n=1 Tax=Ziziphus jujuba var. spinosa TaxID=714518 RepID=A0A978UDS7_ZIZJJ|nr:hypothetical protein FEM48_Zijuj12G0141500 [Ziziphus jujuba var. spinosa]
MIELPLLNRTFCPRAGLFSHTMGRVWLQASSRRDPHNPTQVETRSLLDGGVSLAFRGYRPSSSRPPPPVDSNDLPILPGDEDEEQRLAILTFTGDPQYLEPDPIYDTGTESSDDSFYAGSDSEPDSEVSDGPTPDSGLLADHPWANDPKPAHAIWEENRSGNCPKAFWRSYQPPPSFSDPMPDPAQASWGPDFPDDPAPAFDVSPPASPEEDVFLAVVLVNPMLCWIHSCGVQDFGWD